LTAEPDRSSARLETEVALLSVDKPYGNHNGGMVAFGKRRDALCVDRRRRAARRPARL
jgi:hypothetical protein